MISWRHPADSKAALHSSPCNCRCTPGFGRWVPCFSCRRGTAFPASEMAFAGDESHSGLNPQLIKADSWISFDPQNPRGAMAIYTARKCGLGTYKKKSQAAQSVCKRKPCVRAVIFQIPALENIHKVKRRQPANPTLF